MQSRSSISRRRFIAGTAAAGAFAAVHTQMAPFVLGKADPIALPDLPYERTALQPVVSSKTMDFHYGKHHAGYVKKVNAAIKGTEMEGMSLEDIIKKTAKDPAKKGLFNNAAQVWNHTFYWNSMTPKGGGAPTGELKKQIETCFGSVEKMKEGFAKAAATQFGSGWAWLCRSGDKLEVMSTGNADTPMAHGKTAVLTIDVWEHAYYLDYQNRRKDYIQAFLDKLVNWEFAAKNL